MKLIELYRIEIDVQFLRQHMMKKHIHNHRRTWTIKFGGAAPVCPKKLRSARKEKKYFFYFKKIKKAVKILARNLVILPEFMAFCPNFFKTGGAAAPPAPLANTPMYIMSKNPTFENQEFRFKEIKLEGSFLHFHARGKTISGVESSI